MSDLQTKYQKLATEYAKLKAQLPVLKKAVQDEQEKEASLKEVLKEKDQCIRKSEQELESLLFRNQQLSARVSVLQDELDKNTLQTHKRNRSNASQDMFSGPNMVVVNEELQNKIKENERLHKELSQLRKDTDNSIMQLKDRVDALEYSEGQHAQKAEALSKEHKVQLDKLREEKAIMEVRLETQEQAVRDAKLKAAEAEDRMSFLESKITEELAAAKKTIQNKIPFNDTRYKELNSLNVPTHDRKQQLRTKEHLQIIYNTVAELCKGLSDVLTYWSQRCQMFPSRGSGDPPEPATSMLLNHLKESPSLLKAVDNSFRMFHEAQTVNSLTTLDTVPQLESVSEQFRVFSNHVLKLLPYLKLSLDEQSNMSVSTQAVREQNEKMKASLTHFSNMVDKVDSYLHLLASQSVNIHDHPKLNQPRMLGLFIHSLAQLHQSSKELSVAFNIKSQMDNQIPTVPEGLLVTDQCITKSMISVSACLGKLSTFMTENYETYTGLIGYRIRGGSVLNVSGADDQKHNPMVSTLQKDAAGYLRSLSRPCPPSVPYSIAIENMRTLFSSTESRESLAEQVSKLNERAARLEQDKEHWMLEAQLLKIKHERLQSMLSEQRSSSPSPRASGQTTRGGPPSSASDPTLPSKFAHSESVSDPDELISNAELGCVRHIEIESETATRELLLKAHYTEKVTELTAKLQLADAKAISFSAECRALNRRLHLADRAKVKAQEELALANAKITQLQDELVTTRKNYDGQLSTMSEALASMNHNLAAQQDEIEELKIQLKNAKKGKR